MSLHSIYYIAHQAKWQIQILTSMTNYIHIISYAWSSPQIQYGRYSISLLYYMVRIVVDQSYTTHIQTGVISYSDHYCSAHTYQWHRTDHVDSGDYILIEDDGFDRIVTQISRHSSEPCTVTQFKAIINREIALGKMDHHISTQIMTFLISETTVNHEVVNAPRWQTGQIQCQVQLIMLKSKILPKHIINECKKGSIHLIPKSLYTIEYLNQHTQWANYALVYIDEYMVKCIVIKNKQYAHIEYLNWWLKELRWLMNDMNVWQYYNHKACSNINTLTRNLITQSVDQYTQILGQWLSHHVGRGSSIAMINQMSDHVIIHEQCNRYLSQHYGFYTMECSHLLPRISKHGNTDGQLYLHQHLANSSIF